jgi:hypothetical protein
MTIIPYTRLAATRSGALDLQRFAATCRVALVTTLAWASLLLHGEKLFGQQQLQPPRTTEQYAPLPDPKRVFRLESEPSLLERMAQEAKTGENPLGVKYQFVNPDYPPVSKEKFLVRSWEPLAEWVEPPYVCYRRLYFEQINSERYGWDLGLGHPLLSAGIFYWDVAWLPYHAFTEPFRRYECNTGYGLPGDPMPLLLYPPELNLPGALAEAAVIGLGFVMFP